jgi:hypothetical protein
MNEMTIALIEIYKIEFLRANGKPATVEYAGGWFRINGNKGVGRKRFEEMVRVLQTRPTVADRQEMVNGVLTTVKAHQHVVKSIMAPNSDFIEDRDTPPCCSPSCETYWTM